MKDTYFHQKIAAIMRDNSYDREVSGFRSGKLRNKKLYKAELNNNRIFNRKGAIKNKKYNLILLIDRSGSMYKSIDGNTTYPLCPRREIHDYYINNQENLYGIAPDNTVLNTSHNSSPQIQRQTGHPTRIEAVAETASILAKGLDMQDINFSVASFSGSYDEIMIHKSFTDNFKKKESYEIRNKILEEAMYNMTGTHLSRTLSYSVKKLKNLDGEKQIVILTDGDADDSHESSELIEKAEKDFGIKTVVVGIGNDIQPRYLKQLSKYNKVVNSREEFMNYMIYILDQFINRK